MRTTFPWTLLLALGLGACGPLGKTAKKEEPSPFGATGIPPRLRTKDPDAGTPIIAGGNTPAGGLASKLSAEEDIVYTDPDDPDAEIAELSTLLAAPNRGPWEDSETIARQRSSREGKPLLIWFTDSQGSPMCKAVSEELFATSDFGKWATEKLVRLKVDILVSKDAMRDMDLPTAEDYRTRVRSYNAELKKRYKVMGYPSLVMLSPSGEVVGKYRGYKRGGADYLWGQMKHAEAVSANSYQSWRTDLEKKGYREWQDRRERKVFAKLTSYSKGTLTFIEPDGTRSRTQEDKLSDADQAWITEQKKLRNLQ